MRTVVACLIIIPFVICFSSAAMSLSTRIKDIASIAGIYEAKLMGIGLVTGLSNTGDKDNEVTERFVENMMQYMGVSLNLDGLDAKNIAVVTVTATLPPFAKVGSQIDVEVASLQDATSLQGGTLIPTPLIQSLDANKEVYAMASGVISIGGFGISEGGGRVQKNHLTSGYIPNGGVIHKPMRIDVFENEEFSLVPYHADYATVTRIVDLINDRYEDGTAVAVDGATILVTVPRMYQTEDYTQYTSNVIRFISEIGEMRIEVDRPAKVVIDERTGTVVIGSNVTISSIAVTHGSIIITIASQDDISQPLPFSQGETATATQTDITVEEQEGILRHVPDSTTIGEVIAALNALGATPRELISILQNIERAGALHAKLVIR
ncbi:MAG: flagellar basal body P-ring protein FlgI [Candidatus Poribacteria bacterium]|nr:flagellar basal body P-ring protein FlgI [Candidatus Poribacteria bacterium]